MLVAEGKGASVREGKLGEWAIGPIGRIGPIFPDHAPHTIRE